MSQVGFEPTVSAGQRPQTYPLDRAATGTANILSGKRNICEIWGFQRDVAED